jgi:hypothetical protein
MKLKKILLFIVLTMISANSALQAQTKDEETLIK